MNEVISIIYIIIIIIQYYCYHKLFYYHGYTICYKKARGTNLFYLAKIVYQTLCYSSCSCPLDSKIVFNPWNNNFDWVRWDENLKIAYPLVKMLFKFK